MEFFKKYISNTYAGSGNQHYFSIPEDTEKCGRIYYKISVGGEYDYSLLFSNIIDSTFSDGTVSHKNLIVDSWQIISAKMGRASDVLPDKEDISFIDLTFNGEKSKTVMPGEFFCSDPQKIEFKKGDYLCLEMKFKGKMIPYHEETLLPVYALNGDRWEKSKLMPFVGMVGCNRSVKAKIAYMGDSITQGIGTAENSYKHWNAIVSEKLGEDYAFWNLGLGFGRANDAASDGAWLYKAKQNDVIVVCYGVNDILQNLGEEQIKKDLTVVSRTLKKEGKKVILQTVPPFDYDAEKASIWLRVNEYIKDKLSKEVDLVFDVVPILSKSEKEPWCAKYGGHPDEVGCKAWGEALYPVLEEFLKNNL